MRRSFPIIQIIGLPGAGKTTLSEKLARELKLPIFRIGVYRSRYPLSAIGEADAWVALFRDLSKRKWRNCILETTGLNRRESFLRATLSFSQRVTVKLETQRKVLYERIGRKKRKERGGEWLFDYYYPDKYEFVRKLFKEFKKLPADIRIDTTKRGREEVYQTVLKKLMSYRIPYLEF